MLILFFSFLSILIGEFEKIDGDDGQIYSSKDRLILLIKLWSYGVGECGEMQLL